MKVEACATILFAAIALGHDTTWTDYATKLRRDLFSNYDKVIIPLENGSVDVKVGINIIRANFNVHNELTIDGWFRLMWTDNRLQWNPSEYGNVSVVRLSPADFWIPDIELYNSIARGPGSLSHTLANGKHNVLLYNDGKVLYIPPVRDIVQCNETAFEDWPWGEYSCNLKFGSWTFDSDTMHLTEYQEKNENGKPGCADFSDYFKSSEFIVTKNSCQDEPLEVKYYDCCPEPYSSLIYRLNVQRRYMIEEDGTITMNPDLEEPYSA